MSHLVRPAELRRQIRGLDVSVRPRGEHELPTKRRPVSVGAAAADGRSSVLGLEHREGGAPALLAARRPRRVLVGAGGPARAADSPFRLGRPDCGGAARASGIAASADREVVGAVFHRADAAGLV